MVKPFIWIDRSPRTFRPRPYLPFLDTLSGGEHQALSTHWIQQLTQGEALGSFLFVFFIAVGRTQKAPINIALLQEAWTIREWTKAEEWRMWMKRFGCALLKASPIHPLRACSLLAETYSPLGRDLFNGAFA